MIHLDNVELKAEKERDISRACILVGAAILVGTTYYSGNIVGPLAIGALGLFALGGAKIIQAEKTQTAYNNLRRDFLINKLTNKFSDNTSSDNNSDEHNKNSSMSFDQSRQDVKRDGINSNSSMSFDENINLTNASENLEKENASKRYTEEGLYLPTASSSVDYKDGRSLKVSKYQVEDQGEATATSLQAHSPTEDNSANEKSIKDINDKTDKFNNLRSKAIIVNGGIYLGGLVACVTAISNIGLLSGHNLAVGLSAGFLLSSIADRLNKPQKEAKELDNTLGEMLNKYRQNTNNIKITNSIISRKPI